MYTYKIPTDPPPRGFEASKSDSPNLDTIQYKRAVLKTENLYDLVREKNFNGFELQETKIQ